jgi:nucleoside phosphorylase
VLLDMGTNSAAAATASLRSSYAGLKLAILVGICGGAPPNR